MVEMVFFPSDARIRHLYSIAFSADAILFLWTLDLSDAEEKEEKAMKRKKKERGGERERFTVFHSNPNWAFFCAALKHARKFIEKGVWL